jgi:hypothetical protein
MKDLIIMLSVSRSAEKKVYLAQEFLRACHSCFPCKTIEWEKAEIAFIPVAIDPLLSYKPMKISKLIPVRTPPVIERLLFKGV